jgi:hypothetical protein
MMRIVGMMMLGAVLTCGASAAAESDAEALPCKTAEVNPVTGHMFCIDPLGGTVEAPPDNMKPTCETQPRGQWTWAPNCEPAIEGS